MWRTVSILVLLVACQASSPRFGISPGIPVDDIDLGGGRDAGTASDAAAADDSAMSGDATAVDAATTISPMASFFVTSRGRGRGGDLRGSLTDADGLAGADALCATLAAEASPILAARTWRAYLSTSTIDARDRIGVGPWHNLRGALIASDVGTLHEENGDKNGISGETALDERGQVIYGLDAPAGQINEHDILTGSDVHGRYLSGDACGDWTLSQGGRARVGHSDRMGGPSNSWNSVHDSDGCAESGDNSVRSAGGRGSIYCFAQ